MALRKTYRTGTAQVDALAGVDLEVYPGDLLAISGPSGCGKSTLLAMLGALERPTLGKVYIRGADLASLNDTELSDIRSQIGFVFQSFNLFHNLNVQENVELGMSISRVPKSKRREKARQALELVGLSDRLDHRPSELSGGQQQRVAIARALAREPSYLLMDEPTGNLDSKNAMEVLRLIRQLNRQGTTIVMVTHDPVIARQADRSIFMKDGRIDARSALVKVSPRKPHVRL